MLYPVDSRTFCLLCALIVGRGLAPAESLHAGILKTHGAYDIICSENMNLTKKCDCMEKGNITPLGEIHIYIDNVRSDYEVEPYNCNTRLVCEKPLAGSYRIIVSAKEWQTIRCVVSLCNTEIPNEGASGERYLYSEFIKDNIVLTIGAGDENPAFDTNRIPNGVEYVCITPVDKVVFGIAWATDYEGKFDIRTQLATDLY